MKKKIKKVEKVKSKKIPKEIEIPETIPEVSEDVIAEVDTDAEVDGDIGEDTIVDTVEDISSIDKEEEFIDKDVGTFESISSITGETEEKRATSGKIKPNMPPRKMWVDEKGAKFQNGDLVIFKQQGKNGQVYKIISPGVLTDTYMIKASGSNQESASVVGALLEKAPKNSEWKTFWELNDPFKINGIKISCPSNSQNKK